MDEEIIPSSLLPQMKSIWIDEDEEAEKLYGIQAQQYMGGVDDDDLGFMVLNSNRPVLDNKRNINLPPLNNRLSVMYPKPSKKSSKTKHLLKLFKNREAQQTKVDKVKISAPFSFQHISHADNNVSPEVTPESTRAANTASVLLEDPVEFHTRSLSKAFVTKSIPTAHINDLGSKESMTYKYKELMSRPTSQSSSHYSKRSEETSSSSRIVSTSTMATSILDDHSPKRLLSLSNIEKKYAQKHQHSSSSSSELSLEYLRNYTFPTVLNNKEMLPLREISHPENVSEKTSSDQLEAKFRQCLSISRSTSFRNRANSSPNLLETPQMENEWFALTPNSKTMVDDDVLVYYFQPSDKDSPERHTSFRYSKYHKTADTTSASVYLDSSL